MTDVIRKRDGQRYSTDMKERLRPGFEHWGPCYLLRPVWEGVTHYKTVEKFKAEYNLSAETF